MSSVVDIRENHAFVKSFDAAFDVVAALQGKAHEQSEHIARGTAHGALVAAVQYAVYRGDVDIASVISEATAAGERMRSETAAAES